MSLSEKHRAVIRDIQTILADGDDFGSIAFVFCTGGCYVFGKIVQLIVPNAILYLDKMAEHVMVKLDDVLFDSMGESCEVKFGSKFIEGVDDAYCLEQYGLPSFDYPEDCLNYITDCVLDYAECCIESEEEKTKLSNRLYTYVDMCKALL